METLLDQDFMHMCLHAGELVLLMLALLMVNVALKRPKFTIEGIVKKINSMQLVTGSKEEK